MGELSHVELPIIIMESSEGSKEAIPDGDSGNVPTSQPNSTSKIQKRHQRWMRMCLYAVLLLVCQSAATLLGRQYYQEGGKSRWMQSLVGLMGFPILIPFYFIPASKHNTTTHNNNNTNNNITEPSLLILAFVYISLGLLVATLSMLYSTGLLYLPVSTFSLICSSQLAFNAFFSFFLNSLKITPYIINSLVLLTISSTMLVFQTDSSSSDSSQVVSRKNYVIGFICTMAASAGAGLGLSLTQLAFRKVLKKETFKAMLDMIVYQSLVATLATIVGLFASGEFKRLKMEMEEYDLGKASYVLNLSFTAITWQIFSVGSLGLLLEVSSLFTNAISVLGVPLVPILAVIFFHDKMNGLKAMSLVLALWGFLSYIYQQYLDEIESNAEQRKKNGDFPIDSTP